jgi:hypothetical protein
MEGFVKQVSTHEHPSFLHMLFDVSNGPSVASNNLSTKLGCSYIELVS